MYERIYPWSMQVSEMARLVGAVPEKEQPWPNSVIYQIDCEKLQQSSTAAVVLTMETDDGVQIQLEPSDYILRV
jgi:hypothetical protein